MSANKQHARIYVQKASNARDTLGSILAPKINSLKTRYHIEIVHIDQKIARDLKQKGLTTAPVMLVNGRAYQGVQAIADFFEPKKTAPPIDAEDSMYLWQESELMGGASKQGDKLVFEEEETNSRDAETKRRMDEMERQRGFKNTEPEPARQTAPTTGRPVRAYKNVEPERAPVAENTDYLLDDYFTAELTSPGF